LRKRSAFSRRSMTTMSFINIFFSDFFKELQAMYHRCFVRICHTSLDMLLIKKNKKLRHNVSSSCSLLQTADFQN
jgi:hypothetical protein